MIRMADCCVIDGRLRTMKERIKVELFNRTLKEIERSDYTYITEEIFANREDIVKVKLPEGVVEIGDYAFENCRNLEEVICPDSLRRIGGMAFADCVSLKNVRYGTDVEVDESAFEGCVKLPQRVC